MGKPGMTYRTSACVYTCTIFSIRIKAIPYRILSREEDGVESEARSGDSVDELQRSQDDQDHQQVQLEGTVQLECISNIQNIRGACYSVAN